MAERCFRLDEGESPLCEIIYVMYEGTDNEVDYSNSLLQ